MKTDYIALLHKKMQAEQDNYRAWLLHQPAEEILNHTYEYTAREDILIFIGKVELTQKQAKALLSSSCPLDDVYERFKAVDTDREEIIHDAVIAEADKCIKKIAERSEREII